MSSINSPIRNFVKPILFKLLGKNGYKYFQYIGKKKDIKNRLIDEIEMEFLPSILKPADESLDIGANYAYYTERLSKLSPLGKVYAFEPIPFTYDVASMIVKDLKLTNVLLYKKGVGERTETMRFSVPKLDFGSISAGQAHMKGRNNDMVKGSEYYVSEKTEEFDCEVIDIDSFLSGSLTNLSFVKIDIEGAELFALKGMKNTLRKFKPVILIEIVPLFLKSFNIAISDFQNYIKNDLGYNIYMYNSNSKKLELLNSEIIKDRNYILIHKDKVNQFLQFIN
ncbi:FkbM family methyltransferase [Ferruginibacter sp.]